MNLYKVTIVNYDASKVEKWDCPITKHHNNIISERGYITYDFPDEQYIYIDIDFPDANKGLSINYTYDKHYAKFINDIKTYNRNKVLDELI